MVIDILHSKEGMDALRGVMQSPEIRRAMVLTDSDMQKVLQKALTEGENRNLLQQQLQQPQFAKALADATKEQNRRLLKELMKDPEYQQMMLDLLKTPDFQKQVLSLMNSPPYRQQTMKIMQEALQNPDFKLLFMDSLKRAVQELGPQAPGGRQESPQQGQEGQQDRQQKEGRNQQGDQQDSERQE